jgi:enamine deaminase RidA (YjgF/YER057c/UK114 family)
MEGTMMRSPCAFVAFGLVVLFGCAGTPPQADTRTCFHDDQAFEVAVGYCQAVRVGHTLYISGHAGKGEMASAIPAVYEHLRRTLEANRLTYANVVKENVYATDLDAFIQNKALRQRYYANTPLPAATWIQVQRLYSSANVLEVDLVAEYPK